MERVRTSTLFNVSLTHVYIYSQDRETELPFSTRKEGRVRTHALITVSLHTFALRVSSTATHVSTYIVKTLPAGPCRLEKTLSPLISSVLGRGRAMQIAAGPTIGARCPLDHDRQVRGFRVGRRAAPRPDPRSTVAGCCHSVDESKPHSLQHY